ncbi:MAG TPA: hypothetical protein VLL08_05420 [Kineosporiaceae bacterium]|nr:hypothetical protein [Kineosporiaceae bacterium]
MPATVETTSYGLRSVFVDPLTIDEVVAWFEELKRCVAGKVSFGQLVDVRGRQRLSGIRDQEEVVQEAMAYILAHGLTRSAVVVATTQTALKIKQLAFGTNVYERERYIDGSAPGWEQTALAWIEDRVDPDYKPHDPGF